MSTIYAMTQLKLYFLGPPRLERDGRIVEPDTRKATALLAYLALVGERPSRDALAAFLWPEFDDRRAKAALRRTLSALKSTVGHQAVYATREQIGLEMDAVWCDLVTFRQLVAQEKWEMAVPLYRDDFLSGFTLRDSIPFDDWQLQQAEQLRHEFSTALEQLVQSAIAQHDFAAGLDFARRWLQLDSLREDAHRQLMRLYAWSGQRSAALLQYRDCVRILDEELGVSPLLETTTLYHDIQNNRSEQPLAAPLPTVALPLNSPAPLIGREVELAQIQQLYREVGPNGRLLIIEGEPGIGKTRLAETLVAETGASGAVVLAARCYDGETNLAYAPIIQMLQDGLAVGDADWDKTLPIHHIAEAVRLLPELASGHSLPPLPNLIFTRDTSSSFIGVCIF